MGVQVPRFPKPVQTGLCRDCQLHLLVSNRTCKGDDVLIIASNKINNNNNNNNNNIPIVTIKIRQIIMMITVIIYDRRGFYNGYQKGLYKGYKKDY